MESDSGAHEDAMNPTRTPAAAQVQNWKGASPSLMRGPTKHRGAA
jgi:hypothetical protein